MIVYTGEALIDFIPVTDTDGQVAYRPSPGGSPYNSAIAAARLGAPVSFLARIATDFFGDQLVDRLDDNRVDTSRIVRSDLPTTLAFVKKNERGEARYAFYASGSADRALSHADLSALPTEAEVIAFGSISLIADPVSASILDLVEREQTRRVISFDPNVRPVLVADASDYRARLDRGISAATILKVSDEDLSWITGHANLERGARELRSRGPELVVVTAGDAGAFALTSEGIARTEALPTSVVDTIGAGDSFHGGMLVWLRHHGLLSRTGIASLNQERATEMLRFAAAVASIACSRPGADPPRMDELGELALR